MKKSNKGEKKRMQLLQELDILQDSEKKGGSYRYQLFHYCMESLFQTLKNVLI